MTPKYITIEREYGSGGTQIAQRLAEETGIPCYGREILEDVSRRLNLSIDEIQEYEEKMVGSFLYTVYIMGKAHSGDSDMLSMDGQVFVAEQSAIQDFASKGPGIFVGHCASEALKERHGVVKVFIRGSDGKQKNQRIVEEYSIPIEKAESTRKKFDKKRAHYYQCNTNKKWDDLTQYDLVLDSSKLGIDGCVAVLKGLLESK